METQKSKSWNPLYKKDSQGRVREYRVLVEQRGEKVVLIQSTGLFDGAKVVTEREFTTGSNIGKANEKTPFDVAFTEAKHRRSKKKDQGYKELDEDVRPAGGSGLLYYLEATLPDIVTDSNERPKPMLAKTVNYKRVEFPVLLQPKYNGVRCLIGVFDGEVQAISRGSKSYNAAANHIIRLLTPFFENNDDIILDGELYIHGTPIQKISGLARTQQLNIEQQELQYHIYDVAVDSLEQRERLQIINSINIEEIPGNRIFRAPTHEVPSKEAIKKYHDHFVKAGYEGVILRDPNAEYGFHKRDWRMQKVKEFKDEEFAIVGGKTTPGVPIEDSFVFELLTKDGKSFYAKPKGNSYVRMEYANKLQKLIGKKATVRFFEWTEEGIPFHGHVVAIRDYE